jgi:hypothetical protein
LDLHQRELAAKQHGVPDDTARSQLAVCEWELVTASIEAAGV